ncbi:hypothetical protein OKW30_008076 [Paraburkholderia sp. Clong3]|uniref:XopAD/skwp family type III secretion system effector n=1 Tax=Paraburkholderia sp. Clong3 TaxID=2991061 RepID=UPI003D246381
MLAQRTGYGRERVFSRPGHAGDNVRSLDHYLRYGGEHGSRPGEVSKAVEWVADRLVDTDRYRGAPAASYAHLANKLCKYADREVCRLALQRIATEVLRPGALDGLRAREAALLGNALSKARQHGTCREAVSGLVGHLRSRGLIRTLDARDVSNLLNALSKWSDDSKVQGEMRVLARRVASDARLCQSMNAQDLANALNALSKWPDEPDARAAARRLAGRLASDTDADARLRQSMNAQAVANALGALSKWPDEDWARAAARRLAGRLASDTDADARLRQSMNAQAVANALGALSKWPDEDWARDAARRLAGRLASDTDADARLRESMDAQAVANALNALSKWPDEDWARDAARRLAGRLASDTDADVRLRESMNAQEVANALGALSKWPDEDWARAAARRLAGRLASDGDADARLRQSMNAQEVANALGALSKWPDEDWARAAALRLAGRLASDADADVRLRESMNAQEVANALGALSKWPDEDWAREAAWLLAARPGRPPLPWNAFDMGQIGQIANALARLGRAEDRDAERARSVLRGVAVHLELRPERFERAAGAAVGTLLKAFGQLRMQDALRPIGTAALGRVQALCRDGRLRDAPLESVGNLCMGLLPLARSAQLRRHRVSALQTFNALQPVVARKIDAYLRQAPGAGAGAALRLRDGDEACGTRCPALSMYQVLKAYSLVAHQWKRPYIEGDRPSVKTRREALKNWVQDTLDRTRPLIEADLQEKSWNLIAQIEADDEILDALDLRLSSGEHRAALTARHAPSRFDLADRHESLRTAAGEVRPPEPGVGDTAHVTVDLQGRVLEPNASSDPAQPAYSFHARLTGLPLVEVRLPGALSGFMLARTFEYQGEPWRFDMFGGSRLTRGRSKQARDIAAGRGAPPSVLPAVRYADSVPGCAFMDLTQKLAPQREDWSRMQRALTERVPRDHVVEGTLRLGWFEDLPGAEHAFRLSGPQGERIALCPNDGCGLLRWDVAMRIPVVREHIEAWQAVRAGRGSEAQRKLVEGREPGFNTMPPQALMHFPRDEAALAEAREAMKHRLDGLHEQDRGRNAGAAGPQLLPEAVDRLTLYQLAVSGGYLGRRIRAVPSADDRLYLPSIPLPGFGRLQDDVLVGKPPYDKENLLPIALGQVVTPGQGDVTAQFLDECFAIQYSYTGFDDDSATAADMLHSKGMLIIAPQGYWSPDHPELHLACSREDLKTLSRWKHGRERAALPQRMLSTGSLRVKDVLLPGRLGAIPIAELRTRNMDTDGDDAFVYAGYPALAAHIRREMAGRRERRGAERSFKPPKTAHAALDEQGRYHPGRAREILAEQRGGALLGQASTLAMRFLAQPDELREAMARSMMFGTYDGVERDLRNGLRKLLSQDEDAPSLQQLQTQAYEAIERAHEPQAHEAAHLLHALSGQLGTDRAQAPPLPPALAQRFTALGSAYGQAGDTAGRIHAVLDNYPVCRLSRAQFPGGQPGLVRGEPELSMRNLFTVAVKVGTDALKSDTGTDLFTSVIEHCEMVERHYPDRLRQVPYSKQTVAEIRDGRFDPQRAQTVLRQMPTMAAGVMEDAVRALQQAGLLGVPATPAERARTVSQEALEREARVLNERAQWAEPRITALLRAALEGCGVRGHEPEQAGLAGEQHRLKSLGSLGAKLRRLIGGEPQLDLAQASARVNDALRYSVVLPRQTFVAHYRQILAGLDGQGYAMIQRINHFNRKSSAFRAVSVTLQGPDGPAWEIQFHTVETFGCKEQHQDLYKEAQRKRQEGAAQDTIWSLLSPAREAFCLLAVPPGVEEIEDWKPEAELMVRPRPPAPAVQGEPVALVGLASQIEMRARRIESAVSPSLQRALALHGAKLREDGTGGDWRKFIFKKPKKIADKIALLQRDQRLGTPQEAAVRVRDALRYEVILKPEGFVQAAQGILSSLQGDGMTVMRVNNGFTAEQTSYAGLNVNMHATDKDGGGDWEIQFHTPDSLHCKLRTHRTYERMRALPPQDPGKEAHLETLRSAAKGVGRPPHIGMIASFVGYRESATAHQAQGGPMNPPSGGTAAGRQGGEPATAHRAPAPRHVVGIDRRRGNPGRADERARESGLAAMRIPRKENSHSTAK